MDAYLQFLVSKTTVLGVTLENWMLLGAGILAIWVIGFVSIAKE